MMNKEELVAYREGIRQELKQDRAGLERVKLVVKQKEATIDLLNKQIEEQETSVEALKDISKNGVR